MDGVARRPARVYVQWGTAPENSNYDDSCRNLVDQMNNADVHICIDPRLSGSGKEADYWLNLRPGTDGALALSLAAHYPEARSCGLGVRQALDRMRPSSWWKTWSPRAAATIELFTPMAGSTADSPAPPADVVGTEAEDAPSEGERCRRGRQPPQVLWPGTRRPTTVRAAWCCWDVDTTQWEGCNHVAPTRDQMEVSVRGHFPGGIPAAHLLLASWWKPASTLDMRRRRTR